MRFTTFVFITALAIAMAAPAAAAGTVYKWVDEQGNVHFGQQRPSGMLPDEVEIKGSPVSAEQSAAELERLRGKAGFGAQKKEQAAAPDAAATQDEEEFRRESCRRARKNLETLQNSPQRIMEKGPDGEMVRLDDEARAKRLELSRAQVKEFCD